MDGETQSSGLGTIKSHLRIDILSLVLGPLTPLAGLFSESEVPLALGTINETFALVFYTAAPVGTLLAGVALVFRLGERWAAVTGLILCAPSAVLVFGLFAARYFVAP